MKLSTKTVSSLYVAVRDVAVRSHAVGDKQLKKLERILRRHDRKGDLRASILGIEPVEYREQQRQYPMEQLVKKYGFDDIASFFVALYAKLRHELRSRGWKVSRIKRLETAA